MKTRKCFAGRLLGATLMLCLLTSSSFATGCVKRQVVVVPADRQLKEVPGEPGWFKISAGHLRELYEDNALLLQQLNACRAGSK